MPTVVPLEHIGMRAYLDIETSYDESISVIGIYRPDSGTWLLVGGGVCDLNLYAALRGVTTLVTFNGSSFDLPVIRKRLGIDLKRDFEHCDLMHYCRKQGLRGGLKAIERKVGILRETAGVSGRDAPNLWHRYQQHDDRAALVMLLRYNRDDVVNLARLEERLENHIDPPVAEAIHVLMFAPHSQDSCGDAST